MTDMIVGRPSKRIFLCLALFIFPSKKIAGRVIINNEHRRVSIAGVNYIILRVRGRRVLRAGFLNEPYGILRVRGRPFQECDSFSRHKGSRFNDCRLA